MAEKYKNKFDKLANAPIKGLISSLAVPTILSMLVSAFYNMADSFFVGKINNAKCSINRNCIFDNDAFTGNRIFPRKRKRNND